METLTQQLKEQLIQALNLEDITPEDIGDDMPLFGDGLGLDSIDALEIILVLEKYHGVKIENPNEAKPIFYSIRTLADYIEKTSDNNENSRHGHRHRISDRHRQ